MPKTESLAEQGTRKEIKRRVILKGTRPLMFDRYAGDNSTKLEPWQKLSFAADGKTLILPSLNLMSFLSAQNTPSAPKRLLDKRKYRETANACLSFVFIEPFEIPILRDGKPIQFGAFDGDRDPVSGIYIHRCVARLKDGIPNPKVRPVIPLPWEVAFSLTIEPNSEIQEAQLKFLFTAGGRAIGLGTFRGVFGKFDVLTWE
jgi:hypothetical protein